MLGKGRGRRKIFHRRSAAVMWVACIACLTLSLSISERYLPQLTSWRLHCWAWFQQVRVMAGAPMRGLETWVAALSNRHNWYTQYQRLLSEQRYQAVQVAQINELRRENRELARLLKSAELAQVRQLSWLAAPLINLPQKQFNFRFMLGKGQENGGVRSGDLVVSEGGVVGQIEEAKPHASVVIPIISEDSVVPVQVERTGSTCFCVGAGPDKLMLLNVANSSDIKAGDRLLTSDLGGSWLPGYLVGTVRQVIKVNDQAFLTVEVQPAVDCWCLRHVLILRAHGR